MCCSRLQDAQEVSIKIIHKRLFDEYKSDKEYDEKNKSLPYHANCMFDATLDSSQRGPLLFAGCGPRLPETKEVKETKDEQSPIDYTNNPVNNKLDKFFEYLIDNKITEILALGSKVGSAINWGIDFCDYAITPRTYQIGHFSVTVKNRENNENKFKQDENYILILDTIKTTLAITDNNTKSSYVINVTTIPFSDGQVFYLSNKSIPKEYKTPKEERQHLRNYTKVLLEQYNISLKNNTYVHCKLGINRSAHVVFMFRLVYKYLTIFRQKKIEHAAQAVINEVNILREKRNPFLITRIQFYNAIESAEVLYKLSLGKLPKFFIAAKEMAEEQKPSSRQCVIM